MSALFCASVLIFFNPLRDEVPQETSHLSDFDSTSASLPLLHDESSSTESNQEQEIAPNLASIFELPTYFESSVELDQMLRKAGQRELFDLFDQSHRVNGVERRRFTQTEILRKVTSFEPSQAILLAQTLPQSQYEYFAAVIYGDWSLFDIEAAIAYGKDHVPTLSWDGKQAALEQIYRARSDLPRDTKLQIAEQLNINSYISNSLLEKIERDLPIDNPEVAWEEILGTNSLGVDQMNRLYNIAMAVIEKDEYGKFASLAHSIPNRRIRDELITRVLIVRLQTEEPSTVFEHAVKLFHDTARPVVFEILDRWSRLDPVSALNAASNASVDELRKHLVELVISTWSNHRPEEMLQQLEMLPEDLREQAFRDGVLRLSARDPKATTDYLNEISDLNFRSNIMWNLLQNWATRDIHEAFTWFLNESALEFPEGESRATLLRSLLSRISTDTARSLVDLALRYPVDESGAGWEASIVGAIARVDVEKAKELLPLVRDGPGRFAVFASIGAAYLNLQKGWNSVLELGEELSEDDRSEYFGELLTRLSFQQAYKQLDELPTSAARARAALRLLQKAARYGQAYTDEQINHLESHLTDRERGELAHDPKDS